MAKDQNKKPEEKQENKKRGLHFPGLPQHFIGAIADEVATVLMKRLPDMLPKRRRKLRVNGTKRAENAIFLDTSAIIDGRIFEVFNVGLLRDLVVVPSTILLELKHIADSQDMVKRERGRKGLEMLEKLKKNKSVKVIVLEDNGRAKNGGKRIEVDESLIQFAKENKGRIITCDYNLEKKAQIQGVAAVNINALANCLKVTAVPGESLHIKLQHQGKDATQGVGYLDDGTMVVVEQGASDIEKTVDVVVTRVIQTAAGRILFAKKI